MAVFQTIDPTSMGSAGLGQATRPAACAVTAPPLNAVRDQTASPIDHPARMVLRLPIMRCLLSSSAGGIDADRGEDDHAGHRRLPVGRHAEQVQRVRHDTQEERSHDDAGHRAHAAPERGPPHHAGRDGRQRPRRLLRRLADVHLAQQDQAGDRGQEPPQPEGADDHAIDRDASQAAGLLVPAGRVDVVAEREKRSTSQTATATDPVDDRGHRDRSDPARARRR